MTIASAQAALDRHGESLTTEQLDQVAAGISDANLAGLATSSVSVGIAAVGAAAAAV